MTAGSTAAPPSATRRTAETPALGNVPRGLVELAAAGFEAIEIRETHRVHERAGSVIIRAIKVQRA